MPNPTLSEEELALVVESLFFYADKLRTTATTHHDEELPLSAQQAEEEARLALRLHERLRQNQTEKPSPVANKRAAVDAWATEQLKNGASPDYVGGMRLAKLTQPSDPTKRSTIGLYD